MITLGIDHGDARVGVAVSDDLGMMAHPLRTVPGGKDAVVAKAVAEIAVEKKAGRIVVGLPRNMDGSYGPAAKKVRAFVAELEKRTEAEVKTWDERLSTVQAQRGLQEGGKNTKKSRAIIDQAAAQVILQSYLDSLEFQL